MSQVITLQNLIGLSVDCLDSIEQQHNEGPNNDVHVYADLTCYLDAAQSITGTLRGCDGNWIGNDISAALDKCQHLANTFPTNATGTTKTVTEVRKHLRLVSAALDAEILQLNP